MPKVSVIMPVYNSEKYIQQAIDSVLSQNFRDFELIVIDDGSTDKSAEIVGSYSEKRIRYMANLTNLGIVAARNRAIEVSNGDYIAFLDCDDISLPSRLLKQVELLDKNPNVGLCGTWVRTLGLTPEKVFKYNSNAHFIRARMLFDDPVATSAAILRRNCLPVEELRFDSRFEHAEDYELWERVSRTNLVYNLPEVLTLYRIHPNQISKKRLEHQKRCIWEIQSRLLQHLNIEPSEEEKFLHLDIGVGWRFTGDEKMINLTEDWLNKLSDANDKTGTFPRDAFKDVLEERWFIANHESIREGTGSWGRYSKSRLTSKGVRKLFRQASLAMCQVCHYDF